MFTDISPFRVNQALGYQTMNRIRDDVFTLAAARFQHFLGGSRVTALPATAGVVDAANYVDIELDSTQLIGLSVQLRVECRAGSGTIQPVLRNISDAIDVGTGIASAGTAADYSGTDQVQVIPVTLSPGLKKYRLRGVQSAAAAGYLIGYVELFYPSSVVSIGSTAFVYNNTLTAPPASGEVRFDAAFPYTAATKIFASVTSGSGADVHAELMVILAGSLCYFEDSDDHARWVRFETLSAPIDHVTYVEIPVRWAANGTTLNTGEQVHFFAPSAGGQALPHHQTHETGGTDAITKLDAAVIQTGTLADPRLSPNVALTTKSNHFTQPQYLDGQSLIFRDVSAAAGAKDFRAYHAGGYLRFEAVNETTGAAVASPLSLQFNGDIWANAPIHVAAGNASLYLRDTTVPVNTGQFRIMSQSSQLKFYLQNDAESGFVSMGYFDRSSNLFVSGQLSSASLVTGVGAFGGAVTMQSSLVVQTSIQSGSYMYPGRVDAPGAVQASWYLASHASYGLYANTGLYLASGNVTVAAGSVAAAGNITCSGLLQGIMQPRIVAAGAGGLQVDMNVYDMLTVDYVNAVCTFYNPLNPRNGQGLIIRLRDYGAAVGLSWDGHFIAGGAVPIPTATVAGKLMSMAFRYAAAWDRWYMLALSVEP